jgi:hypothetical protein
VLDDPEDVERERRQLSLMKERIEQFRNGSLPLARLINDLEGLLEARIHASEQWIDDFRAAWGDLEIPYAVALDRLTPIPDAHDPTVADGLFDMDRLIQQANDELGG